MERCIIVEGSEAAREKEDNNEEEEEDEESGKVLLLPRYHLGPKSARLRLMPVDIFIIIYLMLENLLIKIDCQLCKQ